MIVYADKADFVCQDPAIAAKIQDEAPAILARWSLVMNTSKTEHTTVRRPPHATTNRIDRAKEESWCNTGKLGSLLGDTEDVSRRKSLATAALHRMWKIWIRPSMTSEATRLRLYNCYVLPILLYNCGTWALRRTDLHGLESFHRRQLRTVIGVTYPATISNAALYERTGTEPLRYHLLQRRWTLLGQILRLSVVTPDLPAYRYKEAYFAPSDHPKFRDCRRTTLLVVLDADLRTLPDNHRLRCAADLYLLRCHAQDPMEWRRLIMSFLAYTPLEERDPTYVNTTLARRLNQIALN